jgi:RNA recognition motif-containing protein
LIIEIDDPEKDENITGNPFNTLFVTHLSPELTESDLAREFELYGQIKKVKKKKTEYTYIRNTLN